MHTPIGQPVSRTELRNFGLLMGAMLIAFFGLLIPLLWVLSWPLWPWIAGSLQGRVCK